MLPVDFAQQLKSSIDIVAVVGERVPLKRRGSYSWAGLCPFHQEKSGSFHVHQEKQFYKCFGCGASGDVIKFVMEYESVTFMEAITSLSERYGIPMPKRTGHEDADHALRTVVLEMHETAARYFEETLRGPNGADARGYLERRGVNEKLALEFRLGFAERSGNPLTKLMRRFGEPAMEASGLCKKRDDGSFYDAFRGRLMFPIANENGKVIAFGGRAMYEGDEPKYLNSPGSPIYVKSNVLYSLHRAKDKGRKHGRVVLVEGYMDVIGAWSAGVAEAVAPCGTALTAPQVRILKRYAPIAVVNFDPDAAGANATERSIQLLLDEGFRVRVATLDQGLDPDEYVKKNGAAAYRQRLDNAQPYFHWLAGRARERFDIKSSEGKVQALEFLLPRVREVRDRVERASLATELASVLGVEQGLLLEQFRRAVSGRTEEKLEAPPVILPPAEKVLLELVLASPSARAMVIPRVGGTPYFQESPAAELWSALASKTEFSWEALEKQLSPAGLTLMASLAFADHQGSEQQLMEQTEACLQKLAMGDRKTAMAELKRRIRAAESSGQIMEALQLAEELNRMQRSQ